MQLTWRSCRMSRDVRRVPGVFSALATRQGDRLRRAIEVVLTHL
jgi:hypothetical protein